MTSPPIHYPCSHTTASFLIPERNPMTPLEQKLHQLTLATMSRQVETTLTEAAAKNLSVAATLEWLLDMELEARKQRAIERRFKCSRLQARPSIDALPLPAPKAPPAGQAAYPALARSGLSGQRNQSCVDRQSRRGQDFPGENHR